MPIVTSQYTASFSLSNLNIFALNGIIAVDYSGCSISIAGDLNGDGISDLIMGAYHAFPNQKNAARQSYL